MPTCLRGAIFFEIQCRSAEIVDVKSGTGSDSFFPGPFELYVICIYQGVP